MTDTTEESGVKPVLYGIAGVFILVACIVSIVIVLGNADNTDEALDTIDMYETCIEHPECKLSPMQIRQYFKLVEKYGD